MSDMEEETGFLFLKLLSTTFMFLMVSFALTMLYFSYFHSKLKTVQRHHYDCFKEIYKHSPFQPSDEMLINQLFSS